MTSHTTSGESGHAFGFSRIIIISSLEKNEIHTSLSIKEHIKNELDLQDLKIPVDHIQVDSANEFRAALKEILTKAESGEKPLLHIDCHGDSIGGLIFENGSELGWVELSNLLKPINIASGFNLLVCASCCYGAHFLSQMDLLDTCPCWAIVSTQEEIDPADIYGGFRAFYTSVFREKHFNKAQNAIRRLPKWFANTAERWYIEIVEHTSNRYHAPEEMRKRIKRLQKQLRANGTIKNKTEIKNGLIKQNFDAMTNTYFDKYFCINEIPSNSQRFQHIRKIVHSKILTKRKSKKYWI